MVNANVLVNSCTCIRERTKPPLCQDIRNVPRNHPLPRISTLRSLEIPGDRLILLIYNKSIIEGFAPVHDFASIELKQLVGGVLDSRSNELMADIKENFLAEMRDDWSVWIERLAADD